MHHFALMNCLEYIEPKKKLFCEGFKVFRPWSKVWIVNLYAKIIDIFILLFSSSTLGLLDP